MEEGKILGPSRRAFLGVLVKTQFDQNVKTQFENAKTQFENTKTENLIHFENFRPVIKFYSPKNAKLN